MGDDIKEYIVTVKDHCILDDFYEQMESEWGCSCVPKRKVEVANRRPISRNTHYYLTDEEAEGLRKDERVLGVELTPSDRGAVITPFWIQTSDNFSRSSSTNSNDINWGLLRCSLENNLPNWGGTSSVFSGTVMSSLEGENVDVIISDGCIDPNHPEMAKNADGTGGSRVIQYNWFKDRQAVQGLPNSTYLYPPYIDNSNPSRTSANNHGMHVAGTVAGNTQGWAKKANIYNINPYDSAPSMTDPSTSHFDYIKYFHLNKPVNPVTGRKNPTIVNCSWGYSNTSIPPETIININYRNSIINGPFYDTDLQFLLDNYEIPYLPNDVTFFIPVNVLSVNIDVMDCINAGVIVVAAAGNHTSNIGTFENIEYYNYINYYGNNFSPTIIFYSRGSSPATATGVICVGSIDSLTQNNLERKSSFSNYGKRIDIWAPGSRIMSSLHSTGLDDTRNSNYKQGKYNGTSMASPQVCGILACLLQKYPTLNQTKAINFLREKYSKTGRLTNFSNDTYFRFGTSVNSYLFNYNHRSIASGKLYPSNTYSLRSESAVKYPRIKKHNHLIR